MYCRIRFSVVDLLYIVYICNSTGRSKIWDKFHELQREWQFCRHCYDEWNLSQNFTPACAITN